jgi:hypothetical protein
VLERGEHKDKKVEDTKRRHDETIMEERKATFKKEEGVKDKKRKYRENANNKRNDGGGERERERKA